MASHLQRLWHIRSRCRKQLRVSALTPAVALLLVHSRYSSAVLLAFGDFILGRRKGKYYSIKCTLIHYFKKWRHGHLYGEHKLIEGVAWLMSVPYMRKREAYVDKAMASSTIYLQINIILTNCIIKSWQASSSSSCNRLSCYLFVHRIFSSNQSLSVVVMSINVIIGVTYENMRPCGRRSNGIKWWLCSLLLFSMKCPSEMCGGRGGVLQGKGL